MHTLLPGKALFEEGLETHPRDSRLHFRVAKRADILRSNALGLVLNDRPLEDRRMRRIDDAEPLDPGIAAQRRGPGDRAAPIMPDQREPVDPERIGQREQVGDQRIGGIGGNVLRPVAPAEPSPLMGRVRRTLKSPRS